MARPAGSGDATIRARAPPAGSSRAKAGVCISSAWSYSMSGMYQIAPDKAWGFSVAAAVNGHQGYANSYYTRVRRGGLPDSRIFTGVTGRPDDYKNDDVHVLDLRLEKEFKFDKVGLTIGADVFNALNSPTVLQRQLRLSGPTIRSSDRVSTGDHVQKVLSPRIFRLGSKITIN